MKALLMLFLFAVLACAAPESQSGNKNIGTPPAAGPSTWTVTYFDNWILVSKNVVSDMLDEPYIGLKLIKAQTDQIYVFICSGVSQNDVLEKASLASSYKFLGIAKINVDQKSLTINRLFFPKTKAIVIKFNDYDLNKEGIIQNKSQKEKFIITKIK